MATDNVFKGLSMLRKKEDPKEKPVSEEAKKLQAYLAQQYGAGSHAASGQPPKKKKKKVKKELAAGAMRIVDNDVTGFASTRDGGKNDDDDEDAPVIANIEEAERLKAIAEREKQFFAKTNDGSGWEEAIDHSVPSRPTQRQRHDSPDASPPRRRQRHDSPEGDASPPRRRKQVSASPDASPPRRRQRHDSSEGDASPPRRRQRHDSSEGDASPPRRPTRGDEDLSPPRKRQTDNASGDEDNIHGGKHGQNLMSDGTATGMILGRDLAAEMEKKRRAEQERFARLGADFTGKNAQTVYRDTTGKRVSKEELEAERAAKSKAAQYEEQSAIPWGGGLKQQAAAEEAQRRMVEEAGKSFHRSFDADHDAAQRDRLRFGDPMAHLVKKRQPELDIPPSLIAKQQEQLKKAGFVVPLEVPAHSWLRRGVGAPPNRYNIKPGRHWDGVDRSNGFERDMFKRQTELRRREQAAHYMAQDDM